MSSRSRRSSLPTVSIFGLALGAGLAMTAQACSGPPDPSSTLGLAGGSGGGSACNIVNLANQNVGNSACGSNSLGSKAYGSSCTGNGGSPEYWCADFARWVWGNSGADVGGLTAAASSFYTYGKAHGTLSGSPQVGDAVVFRNSSGIHHVAIVTQVNSNGTIESVSGDWGGSHGSEAHFSTTSRVKLNTPAYPGKIGAKMSGMTVAGFISPYGMSKSAASGCGLDAGLNDSSAASDAASSTEGGASGGDEGGSDEGGSDEGGMTEGGAGEGGVGEGGDSDGGASDSGDGDGSYAFLAKGDSPRRSTIDLSAGETQSIAFSWRDAPGVAPPADLWIEAAGRTVLQVSSVGDAPFVRAQLDAVPIRAAEEYRLVFSKEADAITIDVVRGSDVVLLHTRIGDVRSAELVLPPASWRPSVDLDR
jgi:surface antigen